MALSFPTGVSGKTTYLLAGEELEDGRKTENVTVILLRVSTFVNSDLSYVLLYPHNLQSGLQVQEGDQGGHRHRQRIRAAGHNPKQGWRVARPLRPNHRSLAPGAFSLLVVLNDI